MGNCCRPLPPAVEGADPETKKDDDAACDDKESARKSQRRPSNDYQPDPTVNKTGPLTPADIQLLIADGRRPHYSMKLHGLQLEKP
jgi:hypothetical protein